MSGKNSDSAAVVASDHAAMVARMAHDPSRLAPADVKRLHQVLDTCPLRRPQILFKAAAIEITDALPAQWRSGFAVILEENNHNDRPALLMS